MKRLVEAFLMSLRDIGSHKLRTALTMLGISIGIFAITFIFTLVGTLQFTISKSLADLGNTVVFVHNWPWRPTEDFYKYVNRPKVNYNDFEKLKANLKNVAGVCYEITKDGVTIKSGNKSVDGVTVDGVTYDYIAINNVEMEEGRYFSNIETEAGRPICVVGYDIAHGLFEDGPYVGRTVDFRGKRLRIIGVIKKQGASLFGSNDDLVLIPYPVAASTFNMASRSVDKVISVKANTYKELDMVEGDIIGLVRAARGLKPRQEDNFSLNRQEMLMQNLQNVFSFLDSGGIVISLFSILVGGFGVFNIMFVAVKERTSEIGIQKALGATKGFILTQFLFESVVMSAIGGLIGIALLLAVSGIAQLILNQTEMLVTVVVSGKDIIIGFILSVAIGVVSGFVPAYVAANLNPVDAIRQQ